MAKKQTAYEELKDKYDLSRNYITAIRTMNEGKFVPNAPELAARVHLEKGEKEIAEKIRKSSNPYFLYTSLMHGAKNYSENFRKYGTDNLEKIVDSAPEDGLKKGVLNYQPKENITNYKDTAELHKNYNEIRSYLSVYENKQNQFSKEQQDIALNNVAVKTLQYLSKKFKDDKEYLEILVQAISMDKDIAVARSKRILDESKKEFYKKIDKAKIKPYVKATLSKEYAPNFYQGMFEGNSEEYEYKGAA